MRDDWPSMREGELSDAGETDLDRLMVSVNEVAEGNRPETADQLTAHQNMAVLVDQRIQRADSAEDTIPQALTVAVVVSAAAVAVMPFGSSTRGSRAKLLWALVNLLFVAATVVVLFFLDNSYAGVHAIDPQPLQDALAGFDRIDRAIGA
uniref:bestrophin-like domain n=1 Tax=Allosalinactinospora lopnorensis TaxID=1352348 RepID=UPI000697D8E0